MDIFDRKRIGRLIRCELMHAETGDKVTGYITWIHAKVGDTVKRVLASGTGHLPGPWTVVNVDVPIS